MTNSLQEICPNSNLIANVTLPSPTTEASIIDQILTALWIFDIDHSRIVWANNAALEVWDAPNVMELCSRRMGQGMSQTVSRRLRQYQSDFIERGTTFVDMWTLYPRGVPRPVQVRFSGYRLPDGRMGMLCEGRDETSLKPQAIRSADALLHTNLMISLHTKEGATLYCNPAARELLGRSDGNLRDRFIYQDDCDELLSNLAASDESQVIVEVSTSVGRRIHEIIARSCHDPVSGAPSILVSASDVTELKRAESLARRLAYEDPLTGLPNRLALPILFEEMMGNDEARSASVTLMFIDLDQFKAVNDSFGHQRGDDLLVDVAERLKAICGEGDRVVRLGGDEFLLLTSTSLHGPTKIDSLVSLLRDRLSISVSGEHHELQVTPSIGIAQAPLHGRDLHTLMRNADIAMYAAKEAGRNQTCIYNVAMSREREYQLELLTSMPEAIRMGQIDVHYQPRICAKTGRILAFEALARWNHPTFGELSPSSFISLAERSGLITSLGSAVIGKALRQRRTWAEAGQVVDISVNVSANQLLAPGFAKQVAELLARNDCPPACLELELTETIFADDNPVVRDNILAVRALGCSLALDDFGTGYSNISRLNDLAVDCIKIDRSLVNRLPHNNEMMSLIIRMCRLLDVKIVAEGVETLAQQDWLRAQEVDQLQGYLFSYPLSFEQAFECLRLSSTS